MLPIQHFASAYRINTRTNESLVLSENASGCFSRGGPTLARPGRAQGTQEVLNGLRAALVNSLERNGMQPAPAGRLAQRVTESFKSGEVPVVGLRRLVTAETEKYRDLKSVALLAFVATGQRPEKAQEVESPTPASDRDAKHATVQSGAVRSTERQRGTKVVTRRPNRLGSQLAGSPQAKSPVAAAKDAGSARTAASPVLERLTSLKEPVVFHTPTRSLAASTSAPTSAAHSTSVASAARGAGGMKGMPDRTPVGRSPTRDELEAGYRDRFASLKTNPAAKAAVSSLLTLIDSRVGGLEMLSPEDRSRKLDVAVRQLAFSPAASLEDSAHIKRLVQLHFG